MKKIFAMVVVAAQALVSWSCATAWQGVAYTDDLYSIHNKIEIANRQKAEAELRKAQYEAQQAQYEAQMAQLNAQAAQYGYAVTEGNVNGYDAVLADSYESAYARRLYAFSSPTYRMPSSYYTWRYSDAFHYASAYDPAFYNIMVSGDMVWVEPKYVTSMFGSWGAVVVPSYSWYYGWDSPYYYWNSPYRWSLNWYCGWDYPYYYGYHYNHYYHHHHHYHYNPHRPSYHRPSYQHRPAPGYPPHAGSGSVGNTSTHHNLPGMVVGRNPGASVPADRGGSNSVRPSQPSSGRSPQPAYRGGSSSTNRGSSSGNSSSGSSSGSSSYRGGSSSYRSGSSASSGSSYRSGSSYSGGSSSGSSRGSYSGGSSYGGGSRSGGGSSSGGGGNSRGR